MPIRDILRPQAKLEAAKAKAAKAKPKEPLEPEQLLSS